MKNLQSKIEETELPTEFPKPIVANGAHPDNATIAELAYLLWEDAAVQTVVQKRIGLRQNSA